MSSIDFISSNELQDQRNLKNSVRQNILDQAQEKYEAEQRKEKEAIRSGEKSWMLPSIDDKLSLKKKKSKKDKKKHKKDRKKHKKEKKKYDAPSSSDSSEEEEVWVEKNINQPHSEGTPTPSRRENWMEVTSTLQTFTREELRHQEGTSREMKKLEERKKKEEEQKPGSHHREINPYFKDGNSGLPAQAVSSKTSVGSYDSAWLRKALKRAEEQAKMEGKTLEEIASRRWGSLEIFKELLGEAENNQQDRKRCRIDTTQESYQQRQDSIPSKKSWQKKGCVSERKRCEDVKAITIEEPENIPQTAQPILSDKEINRLGAKLVKAELMGNEVQIKKLKVKLDAARELREKSEIIGPPSTLPGSKTQEEVVLLSRTMESGYTMPVRHEEEVPQKGRKRSRSNALAQFGDANTLKQMFEQEKGTSAAEQIEMAELAALKVGPTADGDYDDDEATLKALNKESANIQGKQKMRAIMEHQATERSLERCRRCVENKDMQKHLMVSLGTKCYVTLPGHQSLTEGQCCIVPIHHVQSSLLADEDVWQEIMAFRTALVNMYSARDEDCIFFETYLKSRTNIPHMVIHCVPLPKEVGDLSPIYFKKAIDDCEGEWAQNKKLINLRERSGLRRAVPKGLSYFFVDFGMTPGYAHVIEDESSFPKHFAMEIVGGMIDAEAHLWRRPAKEKFDAQRQKVLQFAKAFKKFDPNLF